MFNNLARNKGPWLPTLTFLLLITVSPVYSASINGSVTDRSSGLPLDGAILVAAADGHYGARTEVSTGADGRFLMENLESGLYSIVVTYVGFAPEVISGVQLSDNDSKSLELSLVPSAVNLGAVSVTASRRQEKSVEAPASISVVGGEEIEARPALTPTEHVKGLPAVDVASTGLNQSNVVVRGFNNIFSGALLVMTDNRIARVPSLRFNAYNFIPTASDDIKQIELVSGPGSALYGPNSADGVLHIITKTPFESEGTTVSVGGSGERKVVTTSFRHAAVLSDRVGFRFSGQYYEGVDWRHTEPDEQFERDLAIDKLSGEGRVDFLLSDDVMLIFNGGVSNNNGIELTGLGAGQVIDWSYTYGQARLTYKDLFAQGFINVSDAGDTYLLNTGNAIVDKSKLIVGQLQHYYALNDGQRFTYGLDAIYTRPATESTINGRNEDDDNVDEIGLYLQSETDLNDKFRFVAAARYDDNSRLADPVFSPRAALVYSPEQSHTFRLTYNRAFSTPDNNNLFLDLKALPDVGDLGATFAPSLGFDPAIDVRAQGVPSRGFQWDLTDGNPMFASSYSPLLGNSPDQYYEFDDLAIQNAFWGFGSNVVMAGLQVQLGQSINNPGQLAAVMAAIERSIPGTIVGVDNDLAVLNPNSGSFDPYSAGDLADIDPIDPTITQTFEVGYKGVIENRLAVSVDLFYSKKNDFVGPLTVESPNLFLNQPDLFNVLLDSIGDHFSMSPTDSAMLATVLDPVSSGGNGNGTAADELAAIFSDKPSQIPYGTASPNGAFDPEMILVTYRNFGDIDYFGTDLSLSYHVNQHWDIGGSFSWVSDNFWEKSDDQPHDINLNAPKYKAALFANWHDPADGFNVAGRLRWVDAFEMDSPFFGSRVPSYSLVDLNLGASLGWDSRLTVNVQNLFNQKHIEFIGGAELGRLTLFRLSKSF
ncbi:MAG: TonB-dependent receptor [bacterium]|nr:TonB-dependent receptor [bacterium]